MASAIIHICVAKKVNEYLNFREKELFLGAIGPDISKLINQPRSKSHFSTNYEEIDLNSFLDKYKNKIKSPFDYGYFIHLYTDKVWYKNLETDIIGINGKEVLDSIDIKNDALAYRELIYGDYTNMNIKLIDRFNLDLTLFYEEFEIPDTCIEEIPINKLNILIDKMGIIIENSKNKKNKVFDYSKVVNFIDNCSNEIIEFLKENDL